MFVSYIPSYFFMFFGVPNITCAALPETKKQVTSSWIPNDMENRDLGHPYLAG